MTNIERARATTEDLDAARAAVKAVEVPDDDIAPGAEPTTVTGWYHQPTVSGHAAWQYRSWHNGQVRQQRPVYDRGPVERLAVAAERDWQAQQDLRRERHSPWRDAKEV